ncbi:hypothetical protein ElyMa_006416700 [Elysia marginata]|uniref:Uncharacterized protein n=1 Tax=Elysia marginata TaxID=1093978 RepID=A0AAV4HW17_9GAST|nr:hypothetical protein ElyMa_006416700 [Elysia marginata]
MTLILSLKLRERATAKTADWEDDLTGRKATGSPEWDEKLDETRLILHRSRAQVMDEVQPIPFVWLYSSMRSLFKNKMDETA